MKPIDRRHFTAGILAASIGGSKALAAKLETPSATTPQQLHLKPNGWMPNSPLPVLLYRNALPTGPNPANTLADTMERLFTANGWPPQWRWRCSRTTHRHRPLPHHGLRRLPRHRRLPRERTLGHLPHRPHPRSPRAHAPRPFSRLRPTHRRLRCTAETLVAGLK